MIVLLIFLLICSGLGIAAFTMSLKGCGKDGFENMSPYARNPDVCLLGDCNPPRICRPALCDDPKINKNLDQRNYCDDASPTPCS